MIKLTRPPRPQELTLEVQNELTERYKNTGEAVWNQNYIKNALIALSHNKCCFCECALGEESKYLEVEHFAHKSGNPDLVVEWDNLLPACKRCNVRKSTHNVLAEPIVNVCNEDPRNHLKFQLYRFRGTTTIGVTTEEAVQLNDPERLVNVRFKIGEKAQETLLHLRSIVEGFGAGPVSVRQTNKIHRGVKSLLREGLPESAYSATVATVISTSPDYRWIREELQRLTIWDGELDTLDAKVLSNSY